MCSENNTQHDLFGNSNTNQNASARIDTKISNELLCTAKSISGFPKGTIADVIGLSNPPRYTAFPNPFLEMWMSSLQRSSNVTSSVPYADDMSEGKNDPYYATFNYHTKVPPLAIARYILHYTQPGDVVADFFCGSGMTGLAAQLCGEWPKDTLFPLHAKMGARHCVLSDLSPVATYLAQAFTRSIDARALRTEANKILSEAHHELDWLYTPVGKSEKMDYVVWSDVFICPSCSEEFLYSDAAYDPVSLEERSKLICTNCRAEISIREAQRASSLEFDPIVGSPVFVCKSLPAKVYVHYGGARKLRGALPEDMLVLTRAKEYVATLGIKAISLPNGVNTNQPRESHHIQYVHQFYTWRNLAVLAWLHNRVKDSPDHLRSILTVILLSLHARASLRNRHIPKYGHRHVGVLSGTLYVPPVREETNQIAAFERRAKKAISSIGNRELPNTCMISTQSATDLSNLPENSIDYIFIDPPFGDNIMYSELNYLWEAWLGVFTDNTDEAIMNVVQGKSLSTYEALMYKSFSQFYRVLKDGHWMTVEFHNSKNSVWIAIQQALEASGFIVADVRTLDKKKGTIKQLSTTNSAKQDLIISAYKPNSVLEDRFKLTAGTEEGVWHFCRTHLKQLPVFVAKDNQGEALAERQNYMLFDRMVAFHVQRGVTVPLSATEFYAGLIQRFSERDGMYFLPEQVAEYDKKRMTVREVLQLQFFVTDEASAIQWLKQQLGIKPQTFQEIHPQFLKEISGWQKHEKPLELSELLNQNFLRYDGNGEVPTQIHIYLSTNFKELRNLPKYDESLRAKAKDRWYVPDPNKAGDLEKLRERSLLKEFEDYRTSSQKRLKVFRLEAVRAGFKKAWQERDYATIITVARKVPENVLQEDPKLLMWFDQALTRSGEDG